MLHHSVYIIHVLPGYACVIFFPHQFYIGRCLLAQLDRLGHRSVIKIFSTCIPRTDKPRAHVCRVHMRSHSPFLFSLDRAHVGGGHIILLMDALASCDYCLEREKAYFPPIALGKRLEKKMTACESNNNNSNNSSSRCGAVHTRRDEIVFPLAKITRSCLL